MEEEGLELLGGKVETGEDKLAKIPESQLMKLQKIEDELYEESAFITGAVLHFGDAAMADDGELPQVFREKFGDDAEKAFRLAQMGLMSKKNAPVGLDMAKAIFTGINRSRAMAKGGPQPLNVLVQLAEPDFAAPDPRVLETEGIEVDD